MLRDRSQNQPVGCFRYGVAQRAGQRANCVISNRLPRFQIRAHSAIVRFETKHSAGFFLLFSEVRLLFVNYLPKRFFVLRASTALRFLEIIFQVTSILSESNDSKRRIGWSGVSRSASF